MAEVTLITELVPNTFSLLKKEPQAGSNAVVKTGLSAGSTFTAVRGRAS